MNYREFSRNAAAARSQSGKGIATLLLEAAALRFASGRLGISEYFFYRLYENSFTPAQRRQFIGWRYSNAIDAKLNDEEWRGVANDKILCYSLLHGMRLPYPQVRAIYHEHGRHFDGVQSLRTGQQVSDYLARADVYPFFMKPIRGSFGKGAYAAQRYADGKVHLADGSSRAPDTFVSEVTNPRAEGYLFQEQVQSHPELRGLLGNKVSSVRAIVLLTRRGPKLVQCVWKIPTGSNMSDNFMHGDTGNLLGAVDVETGRVKRVVSGIGTSMKIVERHPDTGQSFTSLQLPAWNQTQELCMTAAAALPGLRYQHWDIALSTSGPLVLEVNVEGSEDLPQLAYGNGLLDQHLREVLSEAGMAD
jgi:hypothetical protein